MSRCETKEQAEEWTMPNLRVWHNSYTSGWILQLFPWMPRLPAMRVDVVGQWHLTHVGYVEVSTWQTTLVPHDHLRIICEGHEDLKQIATLAGQANFGGMSVTVVRRWFTAALVGDERVKMEALLRRHYKRVSWLKRD